MSFKDERGRRFAGRRKALEYMIDQGTFSKDTIYYVRDGLLDEGWCYHQQLPPGGRELTERLFNYFIVNQVGCLSSTSTRLRESTPISCITW